MWCDDLKIALVSGDLDRFEILAANPPKDLKTEQIAESMELIKQAQSLCQDKMDELNLEFEKIKKARKFNAEMA